MVLTGIAPNSMGLRRGTSLTLPTHCGLALPCSCRAANSAGCHQPGLSLWSFLEGFPGGPGGLGLSEMHRERLSCAGLIQKPFFPECPTPCQPSLQNPSFTWPNFNLLQPDELDWPHSDESLRPHPSEKIHRPNTGVSWPWCNLRVFLSGLRPSSGAELEFVSTGKHHLHTSCDSEPAYAALIPPEDLSLAEPTRPQTGGGGF